MIPTLIVDNFFKNPEKVLNLSNKCSFEKDPEGKWPGTRSNFLHNINYNFFNLFHKKIFALLYPNNFQDITFTASTTFQKIDGKVYNNDGWVHNDPCELTAIVYLSHHNDCGTSLWEPKLYETAINSEQKIKFHKEELSSVDAKSFLEENNSLFNKTLTIKSKFNRLLLFDSRIYHSAEKFYDPNFTNDRLTIISFIDNFKGNTNNLKNPLLESMRLE